MVAKEESPAFQFYPKDYLSDVKTRAMSYKERGIYWELCSHIWLEKLLPADPSVLARILGLPVAEFKKAWPALLPCFRSVDGGFIEHPRLERERARQQQYRDHQSASGRLGAAMRWLSEKNGAAIDPPVADDSSSSPSSSPSPSAKGKKGYVYRGRRFDVSEKMFDNLTKGFGQTRVESIDWLSRFESWDKEAEARDEPVYEPLGWLRKRIEQLMRQDSSRRVEPVDWVAECEAEGHEPRCLHRRAHEIVMARKQPA